MAVVDLELEVLEHLHGHLGLAAQRLGLGQHRQGVEHGADGAHVLVLQPVLALQVVAGEVLAAESLEGDVLGLARRMYGGGGVEEHRVVGLEGRKAVVNLLCHAVVVLALASGKAERAFDSRAR